jgi:hypothetical protein
MEEDIPDLVDSIQYVTVSKQSEQKSIACYGPESVSACGRLFMSTHLG